MIWIDNNITAVSYYWMLSYISDVVQQYSRHHTISMKEAIARNQW